MMVHKIPSCAFPARPENSQILFRWMSMATPLPYNIFDLSLFTAKATPFPSMHRPAGKTQAQRQKFLEGRGAGRENLFPKRFPSPQAFLPSNLQASACHPPNKKIPGGAGTKKDPLALRAARGSRTIFGSGLLSHMTLCSIIGDGELNFRVRNGVGCTLSSMATKEIWQIY